LPFHAEGTRDRSCQSKMDGSLKGTTSGGIVSGLHSDYAELAACSYAARIFLDQCLKSFPNPRPLHIRLSNGASDSFIDPPGCSCVQYVAIIRRTFGCFLREKLFRFTFLAEPAWLQPVDLSPDHVIVSRETATAFFKNSIITFALPALTDRKVHLLRIPI